MWFGRKKKRPPTTKDVAQRAIALSHVVRYAFAIPQRGRMKDPASLPPDELAKFRAAAEKVRDEYWASLGPYREELTPKEREFAGTTMETMTARQHVNASWRLESFQVLLWSIGALERLPPWDERAAHDLVKVPAAAMGPKFLALSVMRPRTELERQRQLAETWHWRSRTRRLIEEGETFEASPEMKKAGLDSYDAIVRFTTKQLEKSGELQQVVDEDFGVGGKAYRDLSDEEWANVTSITVERHFALNWLCGYAPENRWDETPTDT